MAQNIDALKLSKTLGRHTRLSVPFAWSQGGTLVDLEADLYTVRVWVTNQAGVTSGPFDTTVSGTTATYVMSTNDLLDESETTSATVTIVAVAENGQQTLVSDARQIVVGDWGGADTYEPVS